MRKYSLLLFALLLTPVSAAHLDGGQDHVEGDYLIDFGYSPAPIPPGLETLLAVNLANFSTRQPIDPDSVWVRIAQGDNVHFAGTLQPQAQQTAFSFIFPEKGQYDVLVRFTRGQETMVESTFYVNIEAAPFKIHSNVFLLIAIFTAIGAILFYLYQFLKPHKKKMIRAVIFDLGGVLIPDDTPLIRRTISKKTGISLHDLDAFMKRHHADITRGHMDLHQAYAHLRTQLKKEVSAKRILEIHTTAFKRRMLTARPGVASLIKRLRKKYTIALLSNTEIEMVALMRRKGLLSPFHKRYISTEIRMHKPHADVYRYVLRDLGVRPSEAIFIDDKKENVAGARKVGIHAITYRNQKQLISELKRAGV